MRSNHPAPHTLEVRLNGLLMETFSADYAHAIFYEYMRGDDGVMSSGARARFADGFPSILSKPSVADSLHGAPLHPSSPHPTPPPNNLLSSFASSLSASAASAASAVASGVSHPQASLRAAAGGAAGMVASARAAAAKAFERPAAPPRASSARSRRIAERRDAVNRWKRAISIVSGRAAPQPVAQGRPAEVGGVEGGGSEGAAAEAGLGEGGVEGGGAEGVEANNSPILAVLVHAYLILLLIVSLPSNNHVVRKGGRKGGGARAGGARGRKALETKLESIGESGSVDSWHDGYAAAVKAEGAGLRKSISFYL